MGGRGKQLPFVAVLTVAVCFFLGMMITVITEQTALVTAARCYRTRDVTF